MSSSIFRKAADSLSKTPSQLMERFINFIWCMPHDALGTHHHETTETSGNICHFVVRHVKNKNILKNTTLATRMGL